MYSVEEYGFAVSCLFQVCLSRIPYISAVKIVKVYDCFTESQCRERKLSLYEMRGLTRKPKSNPITQHHFFII